MHFVFIYIIIYSIQAHKKTQEENILLSGSIKKFFNYCSFRLHPNVSFGPLEDANGNLTDNNSSKVELFNVFFSKC